MEKIGVIGGGVIGAGWTARFIENGYHVSVYDPAPDARQKIEAVLANAEYAYKKLTRYRLKKCGIVIYSKTPEEAVSDSRWIVESIPERLEIKQKIYADIEKSAPTDTVIASSTSGILPTRLQEKMTHPERLVVAHPFNPVYLLPVVEIVGGQQTDSGTINRAVNFYEHIGMKPIHIKKEIDAFVADRLLESLWRESLWLIKDGICTTKELDDIVSCGFGLRYAQMGIFDTYRVAGGEAGMRHFMGQFGPYLKYPWSKLTHVPEFTNELVDLIADQSDEQSGQHTIRELERIRDNNLIGILHALKVRKQGAGKILADYENKRARTIQLDTCEEDFSETILTLTRVVPPEWADYNGHMNESRYAECFSEATDTFLIIIGCDADYVATGGSYFTAENHFRFLKEITVNQTVQVKTQLIYGAGKKLHLFHNLYDDIGQLAATGETMLLHVSLSTRSVCEPAPFILKKLTDIFEQHGKLPKPDGLCRFVGQKN